LTDGWHEEPETGSRADPSRPATAPSTLVRTAGAGRGPSLIVVAVVVFLAIALVKPWPGAGAPRPTSIPRAPAPTERPSLDPLAAVRVDCQEPPSWRIFSRERWPGGTLRSWLSLVPNPSAIQPLDPSLAVMPMTPEVEALGFCAPWAGAERPPDDAVVEAWAIVDDASAGRAVRTALPLTLRSASLTLHPPLGALFAPPVVPGRIRTDLWPSGTYVMTVVGAGFRRSWAVRIAAPDAASRAP
jgi:hypothetical protein